MSQYLLQGALVAKEGLKDQLAEVMVQASLLMQQNPNCYLYTVGFSDEDEHTVHITELWASEQAHQQSLHTPGVKELIMQALPLLAEQPQKGKSYSIISETGLGKG